MALGARPNTGWAQVTTTAAVLSATSVPCPRGVALYCASAFSIGNRDTITHQTNADTDGFPVPAGTVFEVPPGFWPVGTAPDLNSLYARAGGTVNVFLMYL